MPVAPGTAGLGLADPRSSLVINLGEGATMRRPVELCLVALAATSGIVLFGGGAPSGMSPLSVLEARTVIGGGPTVDSGCTQGQLLTTEAPPGTGCAGTCLRIPNVFSKG